LMMQQCVTFTSSNGQNILANQVWFFLFGRKIVMIR
jgi:hypothetical protein